MKTYLICIGGLYHCWNWTYSRSGGVLILQLISLHSRGCIAYSLLLSQVVSRWHILPRFCWGQAVSSVWCCSLKCSSVVCLRLPMAVPSSFLTAVSHSFTSVSSGEWFMTLVFISRFLGCFFNGFFFGLHQMLSFYSYRIFYSMCCCSDEVLGERTQKTWRQMS